MSSKLMKTNLKLVVLGRLLPLTFFFIVGWWLSCFFVQFSLIFFLLDVCYSRKGTSLFIRKFTYRWHSFWWLFFSWQLIRQISGVSRGRLWFRILILNSLYCSLLHLSFFLFFITIFMLDISVSLSFFHITG